MLMKQIMYIVSYDFGVNSLNHLFYNVCPYTAASLDGDIMKPLSVGALHSLVQGTLHAVIVLPSFPRPIIICCIYAQ